MLHSLVAIFYHHATILASFKNTRPNQSESYRITSSKTIPRTSYNNRTQHNAAYTSGHGSDTTPSSVPQKTPYANMDKDTSLTFMSRNRRHTSREPPITTIVRLPPQNEGHANLNGLDYREKRPIATNSSFLHHTSFARLPNPGDAQRFVVEELMVQNALVAQPHNTLDAA